MRKKPLQEKIERKVLAAAIDVRIAKSLKSFSEEIDKPQYIMVEEALRTYLLRQRKIYDARLKREKDHCTVTNT